MHVRSVRIHSHRFPDTASYPFDQRVLLETPRINFTTPVTFFIGENGAGKTTLIEALCRRCGMHMWRGRAGRGTYPGPTTSGIPAACRL